MHLITTRAALLTGAAILLTACAAISASAQDYTVGANARAFAMGGAGIALLHNLGSDGRANPATLAFERKGVVPTTPTLAFRADGAANSNVGSTFLMNGAQPKDAISIAAQYGTENAEFGVNAYTALRVGKFEVSASAVGISHVLPNAAWSNWVQNGQRLYNTLPSNAKTEFYSAGYVTLPAVAYGTTLPGDVAGKTRQVAVGLRVKEMQGMYSHVAVEKDYDSVSNRPTLSADLAPEMGGQTELKNRGTGADLGILVAPRLRSGVSAGLVVNNLVKPSLVFESRDLSGQVVNRFDIIQRSVTAGLGWAAANGKTTAAADFVDIGGTRDLEGRPTQDVRVGVEQWLTRRLAVRGGYSQINGATYGIGLFGVNVAFGGKVPLEIGRSLNF